MIGIIGAMEVEVKALKQMLENPKTETISGAEYVSGKLYGKDVVVACCGIGKVFAAIAAEAMILKYSPELIINSGVGGAVAEGLEIADIVIADKVIEYDMDTTAFGDPRGYLSGLDIVDIPASEKAVGLFAECAGKLGIKHYVGKIASGDKFVDSMEDKKAIGRDFDALACEMEGASIGHVCYVNKIPFAVLRSVSDSLDDNSSMEYSEFTHLAAENSIKVIKSFVQNYR